MNFAQIGIIPHENPHTPLKAETTAAGETLQGLGGGGGEKSKGFNICVLRHYFLPNDLLHHRGRENAT